MERLCTGYIRTLNKIQFFIKRKENRNARQEIRDTRDKRDTRDTRDKQKNKMIRTKKKQEIGNERKKETNERNNAEKK
jgi:hypothetical protein